MKVNQVFINAISSPAKKVGLLGGTRSGKSWALAQIAVLWLRNGTVGNVSCFKGVMDIVRKTLPALRNSFLRDFETICQEIDFHPARTYDDFYFESRMVSFYSLDMSEKVKSRKRDLLIINELTSLDEQDYIELSVRTRLKIWADWNPEFSSWVRKAEQDMDVYKSYYVDNLFLGRHEIEEIESLKSNPYLWATLGLGEYISPRGLVLPNFNTFTDLPFDVANFAKWYGGLDFGMNDPTALVKVGIYKRTIWVYELVYMSNLSNSLLVDVVNEKCRDVAIFADNDKRAVNDLQNRGLRNLTFAVKGNILPGIRRLQDLEINVHVSAKNVIRELRSYIYEKDTDIPQDKNNHSIDAIRYVTNTKADAFIPESFRVNKYDNAVKYQPYQGFYQRF